MDNMRKLKKNYEDVEIPEELDFVVRKALDTHKRKLKKGSKKGLKWTSGVAAAVLILFATVNMNSSIAYAMSEVPVVGKLVKVLMVKEYKINEDTYNAEVKVPAVEGLENKELQNSLNEKYLAENEKLYAEFSKEVEELKAAGGGHLGVDSGYVIKTDTDRILSIGRYVVNTVGSSSTTFKYDTVDKQNQILITLPSLFKDESYIDIISENIKAQMRQQMKEDAKKIYWVEEGDISAFEKIKADQSFYISSSQKLIISFDKYEVAPGYMGVVEFEIPTEVLSEVLVSNEYIK
ncbi:MAG: anti-sigma factor [Clostridia bacterium]|nr:anti-sigma factor [Clostridia bacterium]